MKRELISVANLGTFFNDREVQKVWQELKPLFYGL